MMKMMLYTLCAKNQYVLRLQERASGMYRLSAFYFARSASDLPFEATPSLFVFIIYFMVRFCLCSMPRLPRWTGQRLYVVAYLHMGVVCGKCCALSRLS